MSRINFRNKGNWTPEKYFMISIIFIFALIALIPIIFFFIMYLLQLVLGSYYYKIPIVGFYIFFLGITSISLILIAYKIKKSQKQNNNEIPFIDISTDKIFLSSNNQTINKNEIKQINFIRYWNKIIVLAMNPKIRLVEIILTNNQKISFTYNDIELENLKQELINQNYTTLIQDFKKFNLIY